jgi:hypothetical protein
MSKHDLVDVDVSGVHFVGTPANRKRFALVKNLEGHRSEDPMNESESAARIALLEKSLVTLLQRDVDRRREALKKAGIPVPDDASAETLDALEKAATDFYGRHERQLEKAGLLRQHGDSSRSIRETGLREMVSKVATRELPRARAIAETRVNGIFVEPLAKALAKAAVYKANPGLLTQVVKEERKRAARGEA